MSITPKPETYFQHFKRLHSTKPVAVDVLNVANPDALPAPLIVSKRDSTNPNVNKLVVGIFNQGIERLVVGGPNLTGIYINFSDLMSVADMRRIKVSIEGSPVHTELSRQKENPVEISVEELNSEDRNPSIPPPPDNKHLGFEPILYIWPEKEIEIRPQETLLITLANVVSDFRPALRYLNVSWAMNRKAFNSVTRTADSKLEGLQQVSVQLLRPADYAEPPFPLVAHWLNNNNLIYTAADDTTTLKNTLDFAISNVDIQPFRLDCNKHSRGVPYFELIMVGKLPGDEGNFSTAVADAADLVLAQIPDTTKNEELNQLWRVNKRIQGPIVKWEIRPDMNFNPGADDDAEKNLHHKTLLGTDRNATITFKISELRSKLEDGVALVKFRYYNMPDHDDGQIVLFLEKRRISTGGNMIAQLDKFENEVASPLRWYQEKVANVPTTRVVIGDLIEGTDGEADRQLEVDLTVLGDTFVQGETNLRGNTTVRGDTTVHGEMSVVNVGQVDANGRQTETRRGTLKITGTMEGSDVNRVVSIHAEGYNPLIAAPGDASSKMIFSTSGADGSMTDKMLLTADGKLIIGSTVNPTQKLQLTDGNFLLDGGELHATNSLVIKTGTTIGTPTSAGLTLNQGGANTLSIADNGDITAEGTMNVKGNTDIDGSLNVDGTTTFDGDIKLTKDESYLYPEAGTYIRLGKRNAPFQDIFVRYAYYIRHIALSDQASKQDITSLQGSFDAIGVLKKLRPVSYRQKENPAIEMTRGCDEAAIRYGFIANEVQEVMPNVVVKIDNTETLALDYQALNVILFQAVKDQEVRITKLESEMAEMRKLITSMTAPKA